MSSSVLPPVVAVQSPETNLQAVSAIATSGISLEGQISIVAIIVGVLLIWWQVRENARAKLRLDVYREIESAITRLTSAEVKAFSFANSTASTLEMLQDPNLSTLLPSFQKLRATDFADLQFNLSDTVSDLSVVLENYEIVCPGLRAFRTALSVALRDATEAQRPLFQRYIMIMSNDIPEEHHQALAINVLHQAPVSAESLDQIKALTSTYTEAVMNISSICFDLKVETQNHFLGGLFSFGGYFGYRVPRRKPIDPTSKVITLEPDKVTELMTYFENETLWGREKREAEERVRQAQNGPDIGQ